MSGFFHRLTRSALGKEAILQPTKPTSAYLVRPLVEEAPEEMLLAPLTTPPEPRNAERWVDPQPTQEVTEEFVEAAKDPQVREKASATRDRQKVAEPAPTGEPEPRPEVPVMQPGGPEIESGEPPTRHTEAPVETVAEAAGEPASTAILPIPAMSGSEPMLKQQARRAVQTEPQSKQPPPNLSRPELAQSHSLPRLTLPRLVEAAEDQDGEAGKRPAFMPAADAPATDTSAGSGGTEVHISIGRIEIAAEIGPPAPDKPKRRREATSLAHYLAERDGGRR